MNWSRVTQWAEVSDCERYTVCVVRINERYTFEAWRRATMKGHAPESLGTFDSPEEARKICEEHAAAVAT